MGDSSVSCVLSGMTLTTQKAVLIALAPARFYGPSRSRPTIQHGARIIGGEGGVLTPVLLPIFGRMDSYGRIYEIERNAHTALLESKLGENIDTLAEHIVLGRQPAGMSKAARKVSRGRGHRMFAKETTWDGRLFGCFVDREIWDTFSVVNTEPLRDRSEATAWTSTFIGPEKLRGMGFKFVMENPTLAKERLPGMDSKRYSFLYQHPDMDVEAWCDDHMHTIFYIDGRPIKWDTWTLEQVQRALKLHQRRFPEKAISWAQNMSDAELALLGAKRELKRALAAHERRTKLSREVPQITFHFVSADSDGVPTFCDERVHVRQVSGRVVLERCSKPSVCRKDRYTAAWYEAQRNHKFPTDILPTMTELGWKVNVERSPGMASVMDSAGLRYFAPEMAHIYGTKLLGPTLRPQLAKLVVFARNMHACNKLFQPTDIGYQYGHLFMQRRLAQLTAKILDKRIKETSRE